MENAQGFMNQLANNMEKESESEYLLSQYKFTRKFVLRCAVGNRIIIIIIIIAIDNFCIVLFSGVPKLTALIINNRLIF